MLTLTAPTCVLLFQVGRDHVIRFQEVWSQLDPSQTYYIAAGKLTHLIAELDAPLGVRDLDRATKSDIQNIIMSCDIPNHNGTRTLSSPMLANISLGDKSSLGDAKSSLGDA